MRVYGFGEGLIAKATQPRQTSKDEQIAQLRAEVERLKTALEACITEQGAYCLQHQELPGLMGRRLHAITDLARAALGKGAV